jgi:ABC-type Fe3+-siderophore transport system permease subunit
VLLLVRQIEYSTSRNTAAHVSIIGIGYQAMLDAYMCLIHVTTGILVESIFSAFITAAFFKFIIFSVFELRYLLIIFKARNPRVRHAPLGIHSKK